MSTAHQEKRVTDISRMDFEPGSWQEALYETYIGCRVGISHVGYFGKVFVSEYIGQPISHIMRIQAGEGGTSSVSGRHNEGLKVVGVGYGRTGTYSLTLALEELGYPTLHTQHLYENEEIFKMWTDQIFQPSIDAGEATLGKPDLDLIASHGFQATMDLPMALYFEQVQERFPDCKFILTTRENSDIWFTSWDVLTKSIAHPAKVGGMVFTSVNRLFIYLRWLFAVVNQDNMYLTAPYPLPDQQKEKAVASYEAHNARVRATVRPENLLEYNVKQGWEPLCTFLEIPQDHCPTGTPFPKSNSARSVQVQALSSTATALVVVLFVIFVLVTIVFQRITGKTVLQWVQDKYQGIIERLAYGHVSTVNSVGNVSHFSFTSKSTKKA